MPPHNLVSTGAVALLFQILCIVWSPCAAVICGIVALKRNLSVWRYMLAGAICSVLLFAPWLCLIRRMQNRPLSDKTITLGYNLLYTFWVGVIIANIIILVGAIRVGGGIGDTIWVWDWLIFTPALVALAIGALPWKLSRRALLRRRCAESEESNKLGVDILPGRAYIMPFAYAFMNVVFIPLLVLVLFGLAWLFY